MRQTNKDAQTPKPRRRYQLTPAGRLALQQNAQRNKPWTRSTGPTTPEGKARASQNARKHSERAAETLQLRHEIRKLLSQLRAMEQ